MPKGKKYGGRTKGTPNKITKTVKQALLIAFNKLQKHPKANLYAWGRENPTAFYQVAAKLIPTEINATVDKVVVEVRRV
jgi:hypothetical protein